MDSHTENLSIEEMIKQSIENNYMMIEKMLYEKIYDKVEKDYKAKQKELEDNAYIIVNRETYVDLEYEIETNKRRFGFELNSIKRTYLEFGSLIRNEKGKYIPNPEIDIFILVDNKLYIKQDELSLLYIVYTEQRFMVKNIYEYIREAIDSRRNDVLEHIYNISSVEYRQKSPLFKMIRDEKIK